MKCSKKLEEDEEVNLDYKKDSNQEHNNEDEVDVTDEA